eukprot:TRINITY_DN3215_c0_g1_i1.p1 TRINITY_DN3215_c0_g1~~TRINITY_DN3215_c0_g1_i1.p1  ORF type:complete len:334 (+),score=50.68 TRINITY_DN3215_c0_g1_i1:164-1165(+)
MSPMLLSSTLYLCGVLSMNGFVVRDEMLRDRETLSFDPPSGSGGLLHATTSEVCMEDGYFPSALEAGFVGHPLDWTSDAKALCEHLGEGGHNWILENTKGALSSGTDIFSRVCRKGQKQQLVEPLAGILRDPRFLCDSESAQLRSSIDWLVLGDNGIQQQAPSKVVFYDAGGSRFIEGMQFWTSAYEKRGLPLDRIYVWEATKQGIDAYFSGVSADMRQKWEPRIVFYDGIPCSAEPQHEHNPVRRIIQDCKAEDFCVFKLDIDTPVVELALVQQMLTSDDIGNLLDEFFFEHHVHGLMQHHGWGQDVNGTVEDSYRIFSELRRRGVRAHSWI